MTTPSELFHRAGARRAHANPQAAPAQPAPQPAAPAEAAPRPPRVIVPQPIHANSVYRQLMERHDRMHTRHL